MKILLLGNGFDLYHKLPTRYYDFISVISNYHNRYKSSIPFSLDQLIDDDVASANEKIKESLDTYRTIYESINITNEQHQKIISLKENYWFKYFEKFCDSISTWIDFEKEIMRVVYAFDFFFKKQYFKNEIDENGTVVSFKFDERSSNHIVSNFNFFYVNKLNNGQLSLKDNGFIDGKKYIKKDYLIRSVAGANIFEINKCEVVDFLYEELDKFSDVLKLYFELFVEQVINHTEFSNIVKRNKLFENVGFVINFNYTNTYERIYEINRNKYKINRNKIVYLHGNIDNKIILGVNSDAYDEIEKLDTTFLRFKKYYQRVINKTDNRYLKFKKETYSVLNENKYYDNIVQVKYDLIVFGHSLDMTDADIITDMFFISNKVIIYCRDVDDMNSKLNNLISIYGRSEFDSVRFEKDIEFRLIND